MRTIHNNTPASQSALYAVRAVKLIKQCGRRPMRLYAAKHGVSPQMWRVVCQNEAVQKACIV